MIEYLNDFWEITEKEESGEELNPIEIFIRDNCPAGPDESEKFISGVKKIVDFVSLKTINNKSV